MSPSLQEVGLAIKRLQWRHHRGANAKLATLGLSLAQWDTLRHLDAHPDASLHDLAQLTYQTDQSMGALAGRMIERGLLERLPGPGRAVRHGLTPEGRRLRHEGATIVDGILATSLGKLPAADLSRLYDLLLAALED